MARRYVVINESLIDLEKWMFSLFQSVIYCILRFARITFSDQVNAKSLKFSYKTHNCAADQFKLCGEIFCCDSGTLGNHILNICVWQLKKNTSCKFFQKKSKVIFAFNLKRQSLIVEKICERFISANSHYIVNFFLAWAAKQVNTGLCKITLHIPSYYVQDMYCLL